MTDRTHGPFKVGDLVELFRVESRDGAANIGLRFEVIGNEQTARRTVGDFPNERVVDLPVTPVKELGDGGMTLLSTRCLRRIDPPSSQWQRQETVPWSKVVWQPQGVEA
jgi:hypothetical protein